MAAVPDEKLYAYADRLKDKVVVITGEPFNFLGQPNRPSLTARRDEALRMESVRRLLCNLPSMGEYARSCASLRAYQEMLFLQGQGRYWRQRCRRWQADCASCKGCGRVSCVYFIFVLHGRSPTALASLLRPNAMSLTGMIKYNCLNWQSRRTAL